MALVRGGINGLPCNEWGGCVFLLYYTIIRSIYCVKGGGHGFIVKFFVMKCDICEISNGDLVDSF